MEEKINVAEILKDKPQGIKLYDLLRNIGVELDKVHTTDVGTYIECTSTNEVGSTLLFDYSKLGTEKGWLEGLQILLPSKEMRDWSKFAWKKGDILVNKDAEVHIIFDGFKDDTYKTFHGQYYLWEEEGSIVNFEENEDYMQTSEFYKANKEEAQTYINTIEERLGGKLNLDTLEIEKNQPEFKDGDIVCISGMGYLTYGIVKSIDNSSKKLEYYVLNDMSTLNFEDWLSFEDKQIQPITETQQIILFDALAKDGKAWDAEKKQIVDLKPKIKLKPFDRVLCRDGVGKEWHIDLFESVLTDNSEYNYKCMVNVWKICIPYKGNEYLLGTTKDVEG